ncbi:MAG TPA: patatin-like phospholipase family protein [Myxococcales bacterium]|jgi:NTE family protein|nr:patatin-like phospholipase family protein [Myxococcales bacterium]
MADASDQPLALVLSGGGARGAYEAGVLKYALGKLGRRLGSSALPRIFCGTSVGAINACALAGRAELPDLGVGLLAERWQSLRIEDVFRLGWGDLASIARWLVGKPVAGGVTSLLDATPLAELVRGFIQWRGLHQNVADGRVHAMTLSATDVETGHTIIFVESAVDHALYSTDASVEYAATRLKPQHALASAAIPIIFPTVRVGGRLFVDGSVRQNTPISPAIRMGCERVLIIGLRAHPRALSARVARRQGAYEQESLSSPLYLFGKLLDALLLDRVENDLANLRRVNAVLRTLTPGLLQDQEVALTLEAAGGAMRPVRDLFIRPSQDLGKIAAEVLTRPAVRSRLSGPAGYFMRRMAENAVATQEPPDLLSYLLFDGEYARELVSLGERDAHEVRGELEAFLAVA